MKKKLFMYLCGGIFIGTGYILVIRSAYRLGWSEGRAEMFLEQKHNVSK